MKMKLIVLLMILIPAMLFGEGDKNDDHNSLPTGFLTRDQILSLDIYSQRFTEYSPKPDPVQVIHNFAGPAEIKVVFGDWCSDSKKQVPAFLKTLEAADNKNLQVVYLNVNRQKKEPADLLAGLNLSSVPTFIVSVGGQEVGRIVESPKMSVEQDLAEILAATAH